MRARSERPPKHVWDYWSVKFVEEGKAAGWFAPLPHS